MSRGGLLQTLGRALRETGQAIDRLGLSLQAPVGVKEQLSRHRAVQPLPGSGAPRLPASGFVAPSATVVGDVTLGERSSVWYGAVLRGDVHSIKVGALSNIQDGAVIHVARHNVSGVARPTVVGERCTVGHGAILHACTLEDGAFVGMGATLMDGVVVRSGGMVAAGALVTPGTVVPSGVVYAGSPAKPLRPLTAAESAFIAASAENYAALAERHAAECAKPGLQAAAEYEADFEAGFVDHDAPVPAAALRAVRDA